MHPTPIQGLQANSKGVVQSTRLNQPCEDSGVIVSEVQPGSPAAMSEIREGDLIKEVNRKKISNVAEFKKALSEGDKEKGILMLVKRGDFSRYAIIKTKEK